MSEIIDLSSVMDLRNASVLNSNDVSPMLREMKTQGSGTVRSSTFFPPRVLITSCVCVSVCVLAAALSVRLPPEH